MDEREIRSRFSLLNRSLKLTGWGDHEELKDAAEVIRMRNNELHESNFAEARWELLTKAQDALEDYLSARAKRTIHEIDEFLAEVPCSTDTRLRCMTVLADKMVAWGTTVDITARAEQVAENLRPFVRRDGWEEENGEPVLLEGEIAEEMDWDQIRKEDQVRWNLIKTPLLFHTLRVFQHFHDACLKWGQTPKANPARKSEKAAEWRDLKTVALYHAFRYLAGERAADIDGSNATQIAADAGYSKRSSGKALKDHYSRYTLTNRINERMRDGEPNTVKARYNAVILRLADQELALKFAEEELVDLINRSKGKKD